MTGNTVNTFGGSGRNAAPTLAKETRENVQRTPYFVTEEKVSLLGGGGKEDLGQKNTTRCQDYIRSLSSP